MFPSQAQSRKANALMDTTNRGPIALDGEWYALVVRPQHEKAVDVYLRNRGLEALSPTYGARRSWSDRLMIVEVPLFAGYVFCRFSYEQRLVALSTPGVRSVVSFARKPQAISPEEIEAIRSIARSGLPARPWPYLQMGHKVEVVRGCLEGLTGTLVREKDLYRVVVSVETLGRSVAVEVDRETVRPIR
jgi:transcription antitermination factor NusG